MGIDAWMERKVLPLPRKFCLADFYGYTNGVLECLNCEATFEGLFIIPPVLTICPRCEKRGLKVIRVLRKIHLQ